MLSDQTPQLDHLAGQISDLAARLGLGCGRYRLLQVGTNAVFVNDSDSIVARVASSDVRANDDIHQHFDTLAKLATKGAPLVYPVRDPSQLPDGRCVTFWPQVDVSVPAGIETLTKLVAGCHALPPVSGMRQWQPSFSDNQVLRRLQRGRRAGVPKKAIEKLADAWNVALRELTGYYGSSPGGHTKKPVTLHGDPQPSNTGKLAGQWRLIDCDSICAGPPEYDLAQIVISSHRASRDGRRRVVSVYDSPVDDELLRRMVRFRTIKRCAWLANFWSERPDLRQKLLRIADDTDDTDGIISTF